MFTLGLRAMYKIPLVCETLTDQIKHGGERRMVDQIDRDFELMSYNQHPYQLFVYELHNKYLARKQQEYEDIQKGNDVAGDLTKHIDSLIEAEKKKLPEGEKLSTDQVTEIILHVLRQMRAQMQRPAHNSRKPNGEMNDFMEQRRPFVNPTQNMHTH